MILVKVVQTDCQLYAVTGARQSDKSLWDYVIVLCFVVRYLVFSTSFAIIFMEKRELATLFCLSPWCLVIVVQLFLEVPRLCLHFVIVVFSDHTHLLFLINTNSDPMKTLI